MQTIFAKERTTDPWIQLIRYSVTGGAACLIDCSLLYSLNKLLHLNLILSAVIAFCCGLAFSYLCCIFWVFEKRAMKNRWLERLIFGFIGAVGLGLNILFLWLFTHHTQLDLLAAKGIATVFVYLWNFLSKKLLLF